MPSPESVAVVGAVPAAATPVSLNAIVTFTSFAVSRASPLAFFTKSRPVDNVSWILYTYSSYPVVSGIEPFTVYVTTSPIFTVSLLAVFSMLGASVFKFTLFVVSSTITKED